MSLTRAQGPLYGRPLVGAAVLAIFVVLGSLTATGLAADSAGADEPWVEAGWGGGDLPNVSVVLRSVSSSDPVIAAQLLPAIRAIDGVDFAFVDVLPAGPPVVHLAVSDDGSIDRVTAEIRSLSEELRVGELLVGGQRVADEQATASITSSASVVLLIVVLLVGLLVAALHGSVIGLATAVSVGAATALAAVVSTAVNGPFDGTISTTLVPGAVAGLLVASILSFRLLSWFKHPTGQSLADTITRAVMPQLVDLGLVAGGLGSVVVFGLLSEGWRASASVLLGLVFGGLAALLTLPALLALRGSVHDNSEFATVPMRIPDGRDVPMAVLVVVAAMLLGFGAVAAGSATSKSLVDSSSPGTEAAHVSAELVELGGDPAGAIRAQGPDGSETWFGQWAETASRYPGVEWVATASGRFENGELVSSADAAAPLDARTAIINPTEAARSEFTQDTVQALFEIEASDPVDLEGVPVDAYHAVAGGDRVTWVTVALLAAMAGVVVFGLVGDPGLSVVVIALRLLTSAASLGVAHLIIEAPTAGQLQTLVLVLSVAVSLFEIGLIRMILNSEEFHPKTLVSEALRSGGGHSVGGLLVVVLVGIGLLASSVRLVAAFGIALAVAALIEAALGLWLLRPVIVGEQTLRSVSSGVKGRSILGRRGPSTSEPVNPEWRRVVSSLLREEFRFQTEPENADLGTVFVEGTPLFGELAQHNLRLRQNGLRIRGEGPTVVSVKAVNDGDPVTVAITVDHPSRQLLAANGKLLGVRAGERRDGMLWLAQDPSGRYRIAEAVDLGSGVPIPHEPTPQTVA
ncbi:MAG: hypothetical protein HKN24_13820 [Acidimicrobiales bacterium]|nr:hypothetical protein [Acidimicrobiales bacterium]